MILEHDQLLITRVGEAALRLGDEDEPNSEARRFLVTRLLLADPPTWVAYWQGDPSALDLVLPPSERQTLTDAGLLPPSDQPDDLDDWAFWRALSRVPLMSETAAHRKRLGDAGEAMSVEFERARLRSEGHPDLADRVEWLARESDAYGFDILSFLGDGDGASDQRIAIEVKSTTLPRTAELHFFLSSHEWDTAQRLGERYRLHAWTAVDPGPPPTSREPGPLLVPSTLLGPHIPLHSACDEQCCWRTAEVYLPFLQPGTDYGASHAQSV